MVNRLYKREAPAGNRGLETACHHQWIEHRRQQNNDSRSGNNAHPDPLMAVSKRLRYEVLRRDNHSCRYCGRGAPEAKLTVDHVVPIALGGSDDPANLVAACVDCNAGKSASNPDAAIVTDVAQDALRWAEAIKHIAQQADEARELRAQQMDAFDIAWCRWILDCPNGHAQPGPVPRPVNWEQSVEQFYSCGLTLADLQDAIRSAMQRETVPGDEKWRYMCGICWTVVRQRQERAAALMSLTEWQR